MPMLFNVISPMAAAAPVSLFSLCKWRLSSPLWPLWTALQDVPLLIRSYGQPQRLSFGSTLRFTGWEWFITGDMSGVQVQVWFKKVLQTCCKFHHILHPIKPQKWEPAWQLVPIQTIPALVLLLLVVFVAAGGADIMCYCNGNCISCCFCMQITLRLLHAPGCWDVCAFHFQSPAACRSGGGESGRR